MPANSWTRRHPVAAAAMSAVAVAVLVLVGVSLFSGGDETPASGERTRPVTAQKTTAQAPCHPAPKTMIAAVEDASDGLRLVNAYIVRTDGLIYLGANITDGHQRVSSADVWVAETIDGDVYALSGSANRYTNLPDGRDAYGVSAGDDAGLAVQDCVVGSAG